ncbi:hypothetical protein GCM10009835_12470 [Planosporangium flavigriseum]|uniref:Uncharacterized protein n=1 Tax=Planosporangium flavigriseum TaxID=373681 RepID=A0A8J3PPF1_9ACTN|nr:hypothetical protein Pfl04_33850 [Planosporangium flavigriseum]
MKPQAPEYLDAYTDPAGNYAFTTYDQAPIHDGPLTAADVLMANLLSLHLGWSDVVPLFSTAQTLFTRLRQALDAALVEARRLPCLEDCDDVQVAMPALRNANETAWATDPFVPYRHRTWTDVTVSKVLHRLAPTVPIIDSSVKAFYATAKAEDIRKRMRNDLNANRDWMAGLAGSYPVRGQAMPLTRVADILIWMDGRRQSSGGPTV